MGRSAGKRKCRGRPRFDRRRPVRHQHVRRQSARRARGVHGGLGSLVVIVILCALFGVNPLQLLQQAPQQNPGGFPGAPAGGGGPGFNPGGGGPGFNPGGGAAGAVADPAQDRQVKFVKVVLADTEDVWQAQFRRIGRDYREPKLVLFAGAVKSACGFSSAAVGPFYCPKMNGFIST